jgi:DNA-binding CsgD family transcriptional regulator
MKINLETGNETGYIHNRGNLAYLYENTGRLAEAEKICLELEQELIQSGDSLLLQVIYANLSSLSRKKGEPLNALTYSRKAAHIGEMLKDTAGLAGNYGDLGEVFLINRIPDSANYYFKKAITCSRVIDDPEIEIAAIKFLIKSDSLKGINTKVDERYRRIIELKDVVFARKYKNHLKASELNYENQKKNLLIDLQNANLQAEKKRKEFFAFLFILSSLVIILFSLVIIFYIKNLRKKQNIFKDQLLIKDLQIKNALRNEEINKLKLEKTEESLKIKELEQVSHSLALEQKNELLGLIQTKLKSALEAKGSLDMKEINTIISSIRLQITDNNESDLFNQKFSQVHTEFFSNLSRTHPNLTKSELKFCAYLKLNLSTYQITSIMNVTSEAIRKNRYRIRKKLNLSAEESLEGYLSGF